MAKRKMRRKRGRFRASEHLPVIRIRWEDHTFLESDSETGTDVVVDEVGFLLRRTPKYTVYARTMNVGPGKDVDYESVTQVLNRDVRSMEYLHGNGTSPCYRCGGHGTLLLCDRCGV